eukprot:s467_g25.t2
MPTVEMHGEEMSFTEQQAGERMSGIFRAGFWPLRLVFVHPYPELVWMWECKAFHPYVLAFADSWVYWGEGLTAFAFNVGFGTFWACLAGLLVYLFAPAAAGSGIPEVSETTDLRNGFVMADVVSLRTLLIKIPGLMLSVAAGMSLGKEGPLVHVAVCWAQQLSRFFPQILGRRGAAIVERVAAGVSTAFGAPLGGVLFSLEEVSSFFPSRTLIKAFTAAMAAAIVLSLLNTTNTKGLTLFSVEYSKACHPVEYLIFAGLGVAGGLVGAVFNAVNVRWSAFRMKPAFRKRVHPVLEVTCIALVTLLTSFPVAMTRVLSSDAIHALFEACDAGSGHQLRGHLKLCTANDEYAPASAALVFELLLAAIIRLLQTIITFGVPCPAGLFVPSLFTGAAIGRCVGVLIQAGNHEQALFPRTVEPGVYAMVGAAAVLGGVCRVTISLVAIMLELTGGMTYIVPFMIAVLIAKLVAKMHRRHPGGGDEFRPALLEIHSMKAFTTYTLFSKDIRFFRKIWTSWLVQNFHFPGYPVVMGDSFIGYMKREHLRELIGHLGRLGRTDDEVVQQDELLEVTDRNVMRMSPGASLTQAHKVFKQLGCKRIFLDVLQGMLSKKNFLHFLKTGKIGHMRDYPNSQPYYAGERSPSRRTSTIARAAGLDTCQEAHKEERNTSFVASLLSVSRERSSPMQLRTMLRSPEMSASSGEEELVLQFVNPPGSYRSRGAPKQPPSATLPFQKGLVTTTDDLAADSKQKWPLSLAARPAMWEGLDTQGLSATSGASRGATTSRRVQGHLGLRRLPGQPLGPFERDKLLDSFNQFRQNGGHLPSMASSTSHFSRGVDLLDVQSHDMEALQQRCAELEALVTELKRTKRRTSKPNSSSTVSLPGTPGGTRTADPEAPATEVFAGLSMAWNPSCDIDHARHVDAADSIHGMHYTAWSTHRELHTAGDLRQRHVPLLTNLLLEGTKAVIAVHPDLTDADVAIFLHFPPNIFRFLALIQGIGFQINDADEISVRAKLSKCEGNQNSDVDKPKQPSTAPEQADIEDVAKFASRAEQAEQRAEVLAAELAAASARLAEVEDGANAKVAAAATSLRASEAACLAAVEAAQDANEARRRVEEELLKETAAAKKASSDEMAEAAAAKAAREEASRVKALARSRASALHQMRADSQELAMLATCFATWRLWLAETRISSAKEVIDAKARQRVRSGLESALKGTEIQVMHTVVAAWRTSLCTRRTVGSLQAALFAEEADRASALRAQRSECDVLLLQAEARHRIALQKLRTELAEAQAKQKEASAAERLALQAAVRAESIGWPSALDLPDTESLLCCRKSELRVSHGTNCQPYSWPWTLV